MDTYDRECWDPRAAYQSIKPFPSFGALLDAPRFGTPDAETIPIRHQQLLRKLGWRLLPLCALIYLLNHLDCSNIGNAKVLDAETGEQTGMTDTGYSITLTQFAVAYALFDVPSNWILKRYARPAYWLGTLMLCWGAVTLGFARVDNRFTVMVLRVVIGVLEAGNLPWNGLPHHLLVPTGRAFHPHCLHSRNRATLAGAFGGCIACGVAFLNGKGGLEEFRWLFIIEGGSTVLIAPLHRFAIERLEQDEGVPNRDRASGGEVCKTLCSLWAVGFVISILLAWSADRFNARGLHVGLAGVLTGTGFLASRLFPAEAYWLRYGCRIVASYGALPSLAPSTAWVTCNAPSARTLGLVAAMNNSLVGLASIPALWIWRSVEEDRRFPTGNTVCAVAGYATAGLTSILHFFYTRETNWTAGQLQRLWAI
ncbi:hypothetical protein KXW24_006411 [Aspergillus fumigatus]|nr:hypothetical protein KXW24_006411 [Aspergillus fumigatus]